MKRKESAGWTSKIDKEGVDYLIGVRLAKRAAKKND
jgi:hypothetical protein